MAESIKFRILRGPSDTIQNAPKQLGTWYLTTDTNELFVGTGTTENVTIEPVNKQLVFCKTTAEIPSTLREGIVYVIEDENSLMRYDASKSKLVPLSSGSTYHDIKIIDGGSAVENWELA